MLGEVTGYAHSTEISEQSLKRSQDIVALATKDGGGHLADNPPRSNQTLYRPIDPMQAPSFVQKVDLLQEIDDYARSLDRRVIQASA